MNSREANLIWTNPSLEITFEKQRCTKRHQSKRKTGGRGRIYAHGCGNHFVRGRRRFEKDINEVEETSQG